MRSSASNDAIHEYGTNKEIISRVIVDLQEVLLTLLSDNSYCRFPLYYPAAHQFADNISKEAKTRSSSRSKTREKDLTGLSLLQILTSPTNNSSSRYEQCSWINSLDEASASKLLIGKLNESLDFLARLHCRVSDAHSRVLVTGDVNSGKSSLINALIQNEILPVDQQPCTQAFAEITLNPKFRGEYVIHGVGDISEYDTNQSCTFKSLTIDEFDKYVQEDPSPYPWYKLYFTKDVHDDRYVKLLSETSLIDSPGLNSDSYKTMALFAQQEDIDVVVFVLNAANHITLSARDFLEAAGLDKADNIFIIVNKFDEIKNKEKCKRIIIQQIDEIFPAIDKSYFVFFSSTKHALSSSTMTVDSNMAETFKSFESYLVEFLLSKKSRSKLRPAVNYMKNLLKELSLLIGHNMNQATQEAEKTDEEIKIIAPAYEDLLRQESDLLGKLEGDGIKCCNQIYNNVKSCLNSFQNGIPEFLKTQKWLGVLRIWKYRTEVIRAAEIKCLYEFDICKHFALQKTHESFVMMKNYTSISKDLNFEASNTFYVEINLPVISLQRWDLINFKYELNRYKTLLGASSAVAAVIGYQPALNLSMKVGELLTRVNSSKYIVLGAALFAVIMGFGYIDFEGMVRRRIETALLGAYGEDFAHENSRRLENECHGILSATQSQIMHGFYECVTRQRKLKAEKNVYKAQMKARFEHFSSIDQKLVALREKLEALDL